jgi:hypothetical protein
LHRLMSVSRRRSGTPSTRPSCSGNHPCSLRLSYVSAGSTHTLAHLITRTYIHTIYLYLYTTVDEYYVLQLHLASPCAAVAFSHELAPTVCVYCCTYQPPETRILRYKWVVWYASTCRRFTAPRRPAPRPSAENGQNWECVLLEENIVKRTRFRGTARAALLECLAVIGKLCGECRMRVVRQRICASHHKISIHASKRCLFSECVSVFLSLY